MTRMLHLDVKTLLNQGSSTSWQALLAAVYIPPPLSFGFGRFWILLICSISPDLRLITWPPVHWSLHPIDPAETSVTQSIRWARSYRFKVLVMCRMTSKNMMTNRPKQTCKKERKKKQKIYYITPRKTQAHTYYEVGWRSQTASYCWPSASCDLVSSA